MSYSYHERLSAMDASILEIERPNAHTHVGSIAIFDAGPLTTEHGGIDFDRIQAFTSAALRRNVRFQQKIIRVPGLGHPVWIDDDAFNLNYHVRHSCLPAPGDIRRLKRLAGRIMSQKLDYGKPLWELWFVEGIEEGRFAVISKIHHCLAEGIAGVGLLSTLLGSDPNHKPKRVGTWIPRPASPPHRLVLDEIARRAALPVKALRAAGHVLTGPRQGLDLARRALRGLNQAATTGLKSASETPFKAALGPHRRLDWLRFDLDAAREVKTRLGGELDDVVLATVAGTVRRFLQGRGIRPEDLEFQVIAPVNLRGDAESGELAHRVSTLLTRLPIDEPDPRKRVQRVAETTQALKSSGQGQGAEALAQIADWTFNGLAAQLAQLGLWSRAANLVVANVTGPEMPIYMLGAPLLEFYPIVPLMSDQALSIALFSCSGGLHWGFNSDWDALPDLHAFVEALRVEFEELQKAAAATTPISAAKPRKKASRKRKQSETA